MKAKTLFVILFMLGTFIQGFGQNVFINEIHYDNSGTDSLEAIEIAGHSGTSLNNWSVVLYNGSNGASYNLYTFDSIIIPDQQGGYGTIFITYPANGIQNGAPDGIALINGDSVFQFISYEGTFTATDGPAIGMLSQDIGVSESSSTTKGYSLQLTGTGILYGDFTWSSAEPNTLGTINTAQNFGGIVIPSVLINEIRTDQTSTDNDEYIELKGSPGTSLTGLTYVVIGDGTTAQGSGVIEAVIILDSLTILADSLLLIGESTMTIVTPDVISLLNFENGDNVTHLLAYNFTGSTGDDLDTNDDGALDRIPWEGIIDEVAFIVSLTSGDLVYSSVTVGPDGSDVPAHIYRDCNSTWQIGEFDIAAGSDTPGETNCVITPVEYAYIHDIQGNGLVSPQVDAVRIIEGIVIADFQTSTGLNGYFVQEEDTNADADINTSEGIFVYDPAMLADVNTGDLVQVTGKVVEYSGLTEMKDLTMVSILSSGNVLPEVVSLHLPFDSVAAPEKFEGMLVSLEGKISVTDNYDLGRYDELVLSGSDRLIIPTQIANPGVEANAIQNANNLNRITLDDGSNMQNPDPVIFPSPGLSASNTLRTGYGVTNIIGPLSYGYGTYRIESTSQPEFIAENNPRTTGPEETKGTLKVSSFNVLNYFNGDGLGGGFPTSRGANTLLEFNRQKDKIIAAMLEIDADIFGLMEIENDGYEETSAIQDLVNGLNIALGDSLYRFINPGLSKIGTDEITIGIIYKTTKVEPVNAVKILDSSVDTEFVDTKNRPSLAQSFRELCSGKTFTVAVNHLKSRGSSCADIGDLDMNDGQSNCNVTRTKAATALVKWLATDPTGTGNDKVIIIGDMNSYAKEDPIAAIEAAGYTNAIKLFKGDSAYSYVYDAQHGYLDHALVSESMLSDIKGVTEWNINSSEPRILDYNVEYKSANQIVSLYEPNPFCSSDHDPVIIGIDFTRPLQVNSFTMVNAINDTDMFEIYNNDTIDANQLKTKWVNIRANIDSTARFVYFKMKGKQTIQQVDFTDPYTLFGDFMGNHFGWTPKKGEYTITAVPYTRHGCNYYQGISKSITFYITKPHKKLKSGEMEIEEEFEPDAKNENSDIVIYPNPFTENLNIQLTNEESAKIEIFNLNGALVYSEELYNRENTLMLELLQPGIYYIRIVSNGQTNHYSVIKE